MAKETVKGESARITEANEKEINLAQEIYIHYNKQDYLNYKNKYAPLNLD